MRKFPTLYKIDPTVVDDCTEEIPIERMEEKRIRLVNEKKKKDEKKEEMSTHTRDAIKAVGIVRYSKFITVHVENFFGCARRISFFRLFRGSGDGSIKKKQRFLCKRKKIFKNRSLKNETEWDLPKIDLEELKFFGEKGLKYERLENTGMVLINPRRLFKMRKCEEEEEEEEIIVFGEDMEEELRNLQDDHFNKGNLQYFEIEKYTADVQKEVNMTTVEDTMSIHPPV